MAATLTQLARALADQPFLSDLPPAVQHQLVPHAYRHTYGAGESLFVEGGVADQFFLIRTGLVRLSVRLPTGVTVELETLGADSALGWSWLMVPNRWHFTATAVKKTSTLVLDTNGLRAVMDAEPATGYQLMQRFAAIIFDRLRAVHAQFDTDAVAHEAIRQP